MKKDDLDDFIQAVKEWSNPDGPHQKKRMQELSISPVALKIEYAQPAPDGDFEILFVKSCKAQEQKDKFSKHQNTAEIISFAEGMRLSQQPNCCGGEYSFREGIELMSLNPSLKGQGNGHHYVM